MRSSRFIFTIVLTLLSFSALLYTSCSNKCGSTTCQNGGTCADNACECPVGYSGNSCQTGWSDGSIGTYNCQRSDCHPGLVAVVPWQSAVTKDATNSGFTIDISNFDNGNAIVIGTIDSLQNITVSPATGTYGINATGKYSNGVITLHFTTSSSGGAGGYTCDMTMTKL